MKKPQHNWHLAQWAKTLGKRQSDIVRDLDWNKARVSLLFANKQQYTRDVVNDLANYLHIAPHELLMHPADAMAIRRLRAAMVTLAAETSVLDDTDDATKKVSSS